MRGRGNLAVAHNASVPHRPHLPERRTVSHHRLLDKTPATPLQRIDKPTLKLLQEFSLSGNGSTLILPKNEAVVTTPDGTTVTKPLLEAFNLTLADLTTDVATAVRTHPSCGKG
jgi:hypothetical protein